MILCGMCKSNMIKRVYKNNKIIKINVFILQLQYTHTDTHTEKHIDTQSG